MSTMSQDERIAWFFGGAGVAWTLSTWLQTQRRKSRAELDDPEGTAELALEIDELLGEAVLTTDEESEAAYHEALGAYLEAVLEEEVEWAPNTPVGRPDLLIGDRVALELKHDPSKTEIDRAVGQIHGFAEEWLTLVVLFDTPRSRVRRVRESLDRAALEHVPIVEFG